MTNETPASEAIEPVAWLYTKGSRKSGPYLFPNPSRVADGWTETPLYTRAQPPLPGDEVERVHWAIRKTIVGHADQPMSTALLDGLECDPNDAVAGSVYEAFDRCAIAAIAAMRPTDLTLELADTKARLAEAVEALKRYMSAISDLSKSPPDRKDNYFEAPLSADGAIERWKELDAVGKHARAFLAKQEASHD